MHPNPEALQRFHQAWAVEARRRRFARTTAVEQYLAAINPAAAPVRQRRWAEACRQLELYVSEHGSFPTTRTTAEGSAAWPLVNWVRYQRRNADRLTAYQRSRLALLPGWVWNPREEAWLATMQEYEFFVRDHYRAPRRRGIEVGEARLAVWFRNQRHMAKKRRLPDERLRMLVQLNRRIVSLLRRP
jgi:hypothetical protein